MLFFSDYLPKVHDSLRDKEDKVKINVLLGLLAFSRSRVGTDYLLKLKTLDVLLTLLKGNEKVEVTYLILTLHDKILHSEGAPESSISLDSIKILMTYILHENVKIREVTLRNFGSLSLKDAEKVKCCLSC